MKNIQPKNYRQTSHPKTQVTALAMLLAAVGLLLLPGCRSPLDRSEDTANRQALGTFSLAIGDHVSSRTISPSMPAAGNVRHELVFAPRGNNTHSGFSRPWSNPSETIEINSGLWYLTVNAFWTNFEGSDTDLLFATYGPAAIEIQAGQANNRTVTLGAVGVYNGTFTWRIGRGAANISGGNLLVTRLDGVEVANPDLYIAGGSNYIEDSLSLATGIYRVIFTLHSPNGEDAVISEILHVHGRLTSRFEVNLGPTHFPSTLLEVILRTLGTAGNMVNNFDDEGIRPGHFGLLGIDGVNFVTDATFEPFVVWLGNLIRPPINGLVPTNRDQLARLVDAALIGAGASGFINDPHSVGRRQNMQNSIMGMIQNGTPVTLVWAADGSGLTVTVGDYTFTVTFNTPVFDYTVTYVGNNFTSGSVPAFVRAYGGQVLPLHAGTGLYRDSYAFIGWNTQANGGGRLHPGSTPFTVTGDVTLYATWVQIPLVGGEPAPTFRVTLNPNPGTAIPLAPVLYGTEIMLPTFTRTGYHFRGWSEAGMGLFPAGAPFIVTRNITLQAEWVAIPAGDVQVATHTVTLRPGIGGVGSPIVMTVVSGNTITLPTGGFTRQWHDLTHWGTHPVGTTIPVTANITLDAVWHRPGFIVRFNINQGTGTTPPDRTVPRGEITTLPGGAGFNRTGYTFIGWNTQADGDGVHLGLAPYLVTGDSADDDGVITLFAEWVPEADSALTVSFRPNGGLRTADPDVLPSDPNAGTQNPFEAGPIPSGTTITLPGGGFAKANHAFIGWRTQPTGGPVQLGNAPFTVTSAMATDNVMALYAAWVPIELDADGAPLPVPTFTVTLAPNGGSGFPFALTPVPHNTPITLPGTGFTKIEYFLNGWAKTAVAVNAPATYNTGATFTVTGNVTLYAVWNSATVTGMTIDPPSPSVIRGTSQLFNVSVSGPGNPSATVTWQVTGSDGGTYFTYTLNEARTVATGTLNVGNSQTLGADQITVQASSTVTPGQYIEARVTVSAPPPTVVTVSPNTHTLRRGDTHTFTAEVTGAGTGLPLQNVTWSLIEASPGTSINTNGMLTVSTTQAVGSNAFRVRATSTVSNAIFGEAVVNISLPNVTGVTITSYNDTFEVARNGSGRFFATVEGDGYPEQSVRWYVFGGSRPGTVITAHGVLTVPGSEAATTLRVRAVSTIAEERYDEVNIQLTGPTPIGDWRIVRVGIDHTMAISWDNELFTWGRGTHGQLGHDGRAATSTGSGDPTPEHNRNRPVRVMPGTYDWVDVAGGWAHTVARRADGTIWGAGRIFNGGHGNLANTGVDFGASFSQIGDDDDWDHVAATHSSVFAIKVDGTMWAWGSNTNGMLGIGSTAFQNAPVQVGRNAAGNPLGAGGAGLRDDWAFVSASSTHTLALNANGELFGWGLNTSGQLGPGATNYPRSITPGRRWRLVTAGTNFSAGICYTSGGLYTWGSNADGRLGTPTLDPGSNRNNPERIITDRTFEYINLNVTSHAIAISSFGEVFTWGSNSHMQLGRGTPNEQSQRTPTAITQGSSVATQDLTDVDLGSRTWINSIGGGSFSFAIDSGGELWGWGHNTFGMLGNRDTDDRNRPVRIFRTLPGDTPFPGE